MPLCEPIPPNSPLYRVDAQRTRASAKATARIGRNYNLRGLMNGIMSFTAPLVLACALCTGVAFAQAGAGISREATRSGVRPIPRIAGLRVGVTAAFLAGGERTEGKVTKIRSDSIWVSSRGSINAIPLQGVDSAWSRERYTGKGALIGAVSGAVAVGTLGALFVNGLCDSANGCGNDYPAAVLVGGLIGGSGGGLLGAALGSLAKRWQRRLPTG